MTNQEYIHAKDELRRLYHADLDYLSSLEPSYHTVPCIGGLVGAGVAGLSWGPVPVLLAVTFICLHVAYVHLFREYLKVRADDAYNEWFLQDAKLDLFYGERI